MDMPNLHVTRLRVIGLSIIQSLYKHTLYTVYCFDLTETLQAMVTIVTDTSQQ